jgi:hypothetical protein
MRGTCFVASIAMQQKCTGDATPRFGTSFDRREFGDRREPGHDLDFFTRTSRFLHEDATTGEGFAHDSVVVRGHLVINGERGFSYQMPYDGAREESGRVSRPNVRSGSERSTCTGVTLGTSSIRAATNAESRYPRFEISWGLGGRDSNPDTVVQRARIAVRFVLLRFGSFLRSRALSASVRADALPHSVSLRVSPLLKPSRLACPRSADDIRRDCVSRH